MLSLIGKLLGTVTVIAITLVASHWVTWRGKTLATHGEHVAQFISGVEVPEKITEKIRTISHDLTEPELSPDDKKALFGLISNSKK